MLIKKAILIISPGGNGNHMWMNILTQIGSVPIGDDDFGKVVEWPAKAPVVHWFRSMPHQIYPSDEIIDMIKSLRKIRYTVYGLVPTRDWFCADKSQRKRHREAKAIQHMQIGYAHILQIYNELGIPYYFASYEAAIARKEYIDWVLKQFGLSGPLPKIYDGNAKWYGEEG